MQAHTITKYEHEEEYHMPMAAAKKQTTEPIARAPIAEYNKQNNIMPFDKIANEMSNDKSYYKPPVSQPARQALSQTQNHLNFSNIQQEKPRSN